MIEFESCFGLYNFLEVPDLPHIHWNDGAGWLMATHMYDIVKAKHRAMLEAASYISLTADETSVVDNCSYIVIHVYLLQDWVRIPIILHLQKLEPGKFSTSCTISFIVVLSTGCCSNYFCTRRS
jgi:hypothetical protein